MHASGDIPFYGQADQFAIAQAGSRNYRGLPVCEIQGTLGELESAWHSGAGYAAIGAVATRDEAVLVMRPAIDRSRPVNGRAGWMDIDGSMELADIRKRYANGKQLVTVPELLAAFPETGFFIDIGSDKTCGPLAKAICGAGAQERVSIGGQEYGRTRGTVDLIGNDQVATTFDVKGGMRLLRHAVKSAGCVDFIRGQRTAQFVLPLRNLSPEAVEQAHALGKRVITVLDSLDSTRQLLRAGVNGICSDQPAFTANAIDRHATSVA
jgi:hypothetical protein